MTPKERAQACYTQMWADNGTHNEGEIVAYITDAIREAESDCAARLAASEAGRREAEEQLALSQAQALQASRESVKLQTEVDKWRNWHPDDETLADMQQQALKPNGDHAGSLAAMLVYVRGLEERLRRAEAAEAREARLREALVDILKKHKILGPLEDAAVIGQEIEAALAVAAPQPKAEGEAEKLGRELVEWAAERIEYSGECPLCGAKVIYSDNREEVEEAHWPNCLAIRASALIKENTK